MGATLSNANISNRRRNSNYNHNHNHNYNNYHENPNPTTYDPNPNPNSYPTHPPPPPPPYYYNAGPYYNYGYSGWTPRPLPPPAAVPPNQLMLMPPPPPPRYVEHQQAKKVRNDINVHKDTIRIEEDDEGSPDHYLVSFVFDAMVDGSFTIFYFAKEESNCTFAPLFPEAYMPVKFPFQKGVRQKFRQPSGTGIDLGFFELDDLSRPSLDEDVFPLVISAETSLPLPSEEYLDEGPQISSPHMQITQAVLQKNDEKAFHVKVIRQILWIDEVRYELREIYGIGTSAAESFKDDDPAKECVICLTEPKDTAVIPCRHMCMCSGCAKELRLQSNKCPICRQPIEELIEIKVSNAG